MILIAESGSTKCDWVLLDQNGQEQSRFKTIGFNPYFKTSKVVTQTLAAADGLKDVASEINQVWFYGAGCSSQEKRNVIKLGLDNVFKNSTNHVGHDLEASAYALYRGKPVVACIIGTGSNSCFFDGKEVTEEVPSLAYVLGDEGSASFIGKALVKAFLYKQMPADLASDFNRTYKIDKDEVLENVYKKANPNLYLAGFGPFAGKHKDHPFILNVLKTGFKEFIEIHVACFADAKNAEISFVGSVADHYQNLLENCLQETGYTFGQVVAKPVDELIQYHINYLKVLES